MRSPLKIIMLAVPVVLLIPAVVWASAIIEYFSSRVFYTTGTHPLDVVTADFNADGYLDVATANREGMNVSVFMGNGDGTLTDLEPISLGAGGTSIAAGDVTGDGAIDLVVTSCDPSSDKGSIFVLKGEGSGTFTLLQQIAVDGTPYNISLADFDGDGRLDLATSDFPNNSVHIFYNDGSTFIEKTVTTGTHPIALQVADLNRDGIPDLISADQADSSASIFLGKAGREFASPIQVDIGELPYSIAIGDMTGDGIPDLVVVNSSLPGRVAVLRGDGAGRFAVFDEATLDDRLVYVETADVDHDGHLDLIVTRYEKHKASALLNQGGGTLDRTEIPIPSENEIYSLAIADINRDGLPDFISADYAQNTVVVSLGRAQ